MGKDFYAGMAIGVVIGVSTLTAVILITGICR